MYLTSIEESVKRILETPLGSRVMLPEFGSRLYTLTDKRMDMRWKLLFISYVYEALKRWENRITLRRVVPNAHAISGVVSVQLEFEDEKSQTQNMEVMYVVA